MGISQTDVSAVERSPRRTEVDRLPGLDFHAQYDTVRTGGDFFDAVIVGSRMIFMLTISRAEGRRPIPLRPNSGHVSQEIGGDLRRGGYEPDGRHNPTGP